MYSWVIFLHVLSVLGFLLAHGSSAAVMVRLRSECEPARIQALLDLSQAVSGLMNASALLLLITGIAGGFMGAWWGRGWIWASLALLIAVGLVMSVMGRLYFERLRRALVQAPDARPAALTAARDSGQPVLLAAVGLGGLVIITWLMWFKPF